jgi:mRNA-degrading endonuclease RelE of RelBE toxin-antitoxin system
MVDKIEKALRKLSGKERRAVANLIKRIASGDVAGLDIKKLKGSKTIYRARKGDIRIMYNMKSKENINILAIERRSDTTYRNY